MMNDKEMLSCGLGKIVSNPALVKLHVEELDFRHSTSLAMCSSINEP